ncbi:MAG: peptide ABC transporter substrate-binding protein [Gammaproteobacteria bacterium]
MRFFSALLTGLMLAMGAGAVMAKDSLTIGITQFPSIMHPSIDSMMAKTYVLGMARRPFTAYDANWELVCMLCVELPTIENGGAVLETTAKGKPGVAVTYTIAPGTRWNDGTPVTVKDVLFAWEVGKHPESGVTSGEPYRRVLSIDVKGDRTFTLHQDRVEYNYNALGDFGLIPAHLERPIFEQDPATYRQRSLYRTAPTTPGLYIGPYQISGFEPGSHIVLTPSPTWNGGPLPFKKVVVKAIENTAALEANLLAGSVDMIAGEMGFLIDQALAFEKRHGRRFNVSYKPGLIYEHIDLNLDNPFLQDKRVRQALLLSIDRQAISQQLFQGKQPVAQTMVSELDWTFDPTVTEYSYNPDKADALFKAAGWTRGGDGTLRNAKGEKLSLVLMTTAGNRTRELVEQVLQSQWKKAGVEILIRNEPARVFFGETVSKRAFPAMAMFAWISSPETPPRTTLHSSMIPTQENAWEGQNYTGFNHAEVDGLIDTLETELDKEKRAKLWTRLQQIYAEELPALPLYFRANAHITPKWLTGITPTGHQNPSTLWIEHWKTR